MKRPLIAGFCLAGALAFTGCPTLPQQRTPPTPETVPAEEAPEPGAAVPEETIPTVDDTYDAISLSVRAGRPEDALAAYLEAELASPEEPRTLLLLANLYLIAGALEEADSVLQAILSDDPENVDAVYMRSLVAAATGDRESQRAALERVLELDAGEPRALASLGEIHLADGELEAARQAFSMALEREPTDVVARMGLGNVHLRREEYAAAEEQFTQVIGHDADYAFSYSDRALARALQRKFSGAESDLTEAIRLDPEFPWHYIDRGRVRLEQRRFSDAAADFTTAIELDGQSFIGYVLRARAYDAMDQYEPALRDYARAVELRPDYHPAYAPLATLLYMGGRSLEAATWYRKAHQVDTRRLDFALLAALSLKTGGRPADATSWLNQELAQFPRESLYYQMARYYLLPTNDGYMLAEIGRERDDRVKGQMYFYLGAQLELLGRTSTAQASFLEAEDALPPGFLERRLASWHLERYRAGDEEGE